MGGGKKAALVAAVLALCAGVAWSLFIRRPPAVSQSASGGPQAISAQLSTPVTPALEQADNAADGVADPGVAREFVQKEIARAEALRKKCRDTADCETLDRRLNRLREVMKALR